MLHVLQLDTGRLRRIRIRQHARAPKELICRDKMFGRFAIILSFVVAVSRCSVCVSATASLLRRKTGRRVSERVRVCRVGEKRKSWRRDVSFAGRWPDRCCWHVTIFKRKERPRESRRRCPYDTRTRRVYRVYHEILSITIYSEIRVDLNYCFSSTTAAMARRFSGVSLIRHFVILRFGTLNVWIS